MAVNTLEHLLAVQVTAADMQERAKLRTLAQEVRYISEKPLTLAFVDQGYNRAETCTGSLAGRDAIAHHQTQGSQKKRCLLTCR